MAARKLFSRANLECMSIQIGVRQTEGGTPHQQERGEDFTGRSRSEASVWWVRGSAVALLGKRSRLCVTVCSQESVSQNEEHRPWLRLWLARAATKPSESPQSNGLLFKYFNRSQFSTGECGKVRRGQSATGPWLLVLLLDLEPQTQRRRGDSLGKEEL